MGCTAIHAVGRRKKKPSIPEVVVYVPSMRIPTQSDLQRSLKGLIPRDLVDRLACLRNQISLVAEDTGGTAITELTRALEEYLSILIGLTKKENVSRTVEFKWKSLEDGRHENPVLNSWFELLSVLHMMAILTLSEADSLMIPKDHFVSGTRVVTSDCKRDAVDLLLKAAGYLEFCVREVLVRIPEDVKKRFSKDLQDGVLEAMSIQALGQGTEVQLGLAVESQKATLSVKRRLACEQLIYFGQAYHCLSGCEMNHENGKKHLRFIKWKFLEAKAAAYYYHGLILDKEACGNDLDSSIVILENFCVHNQFIFLARSPPLWGAMKHLHQKIPEVASKKSQMYGYLLEEEKALQALPDLPDFQLSLRPDEYALPEMDEAWDRERWQLQKQSLKENLRDSEDEIETE
ncbi:hypothetical protein GH714_029745 [Hevea brasiliensis]|uniref:BRO1 domain-containing protein n=1 Tax=Hevea brasiliensis TaxID=3981 RepID=A0A6A6LP33_HEVBR|nr:hypothetical protein GH714_029745 [Hevea brasiliensis]